MSTQEKIQELVFQALGEASVCSWSEPPKGEFNSTDVKRIGDELVASIMEYIKDGNDSRGIDPEKTH